MTTIAEIYHDILERKLAHTDIATYLKNVIGMKTKVDIERFLKCLNINRQESILSANHLYFYEMSLLAGASTSMENYVCDNLNNGYTRTLTLAQIKEGIRNMVRANDNIYLDLTLNEAIQHYTTRQEVEINLADVYTKVLQESSVMDQREEEYAKRNNVMCVFGWDDEKPVKYFISKEIIDSLILHHGNGERECNICLDHTGVYKCGNPICKGNVCATCYHAIMITGNNKCPLCRHIWTDHRAKY